MRTIMAVEKKFLSERYVRIDLESKLDDAALSAAISEACLEYAQTLEVEKIRDRNGDLNWADMIINIPNVICQKHGFKKKEEEPVFWSAFWGERFDPVETRELLDSIKKGA